MEIIKKYFSNLEIRTTRLITSGWESDLYIINEEIVFRFPKKNGRFDCVYEKEKIITDIIRPYISTNISNIKIYKEEDTIFSVLDYIKGEDLNSTNGDIVDDFTNFLKEIHLVDVKLLKKYNLDAENLPFYRYRLNINNFSFNYDNLLNIFKKYDLEKDFNKSLHIFTDFNFKEEDDVVCHNDLHKGNVMVYNGKLSGIIDFGDTIYSNYNIEFVSIFKWEEKIVLDIVKKYEEITGRKLNIELIIAISKLAVFSKISRKPENIERYIYKLKFYDAVREFFLVEENSTDADLIRNKINVIVKKLKELKS